MLIGGLFNERIEVSTIIGNDYVFIFKNISNFFNGLDFVDIRWIPEKEPAERLMEHMEGLLMAVYKEING